MSFPNTALHFTFHIFLSSYPRELVKEDKTSKTRQGTTPQHFPPSLSPLSIFPTHPMSWAETNCLPWLNKIQRKDQQHPRQNIPDLTRQREDKDKDKDKYKDKDNDKDKDKDKTRLGARQDNPRQAKDNDKINTAIKTRQGKARQDKNNHKTRQDNHKT